MAAVGLKLFMLSVLLSLLSNAKAGVFPSTCTRIECPSFEVVQPGDDYEIRRLNSTVWTSTSTIQDISLVAASNTGFMQLFDYIQGNNRYNQKIEMTSPVITQVLPSDGPFCKSNFTVSFYVPKENQANPPPAAGLHAQKLKPLYAAARQFGGFVTDSNAPVEAAALKSSLAGTAWDKAIEKSNGNSSAYIVAQYNSPFDFKDRVNEIWLLFDWD